jgi:hypothetical protein
LERDKIVQNDESIEADFEIGRFEVDIEDLFDSLVRGLLGTFRGVENMEHNEVKNVDANDGGNCGLLFNEDALFSILFDCLDEFASE